MNKGRAQTNTFQKRQLPQQWKYKGEIHGSHSNVDEETIQTDVSEELAASGFRIWVVQGEYKSLRFGSCDYCLPKQFTGHSHHFLAKWNNCGW